MRSGSDRDHGGRSVRRSRSYMPSHFYQMCIFVDLGFEGLNNGAHRGFSSVARPRYAPPIDWNTKLARARAPHGRKSDGHLHSNRPHRPLWVKGCSRGKWATCPLQRGGPTLHWETQTAGLSLKVRHRWRHRGACGEGFRCPPSALRAPAALLPSL